MSEEPPAFQSFARWLSMVFHPFVSVGLMVRQVRRGAWDNVCAAVTMWIKVSPGAAMFYL